MRSDVCMNLLAFQQTFAWLGKLVMGDKMWVPYVNSTRKAQWLGSGKDGVLIPKPKLHQ